MLARSVRSATAASPQLLIDDLKAVVRLQQRGAPPLARRACHHLGFSTLLIRYKRGICEIDYTLARSVTSAIAHRSLFRDEEDFYGRFETREQFELIFPLSASLVSKL